MKKGSSGAVGSLEVNDYAAQTLPVSRESLGERPPKDRFRVMRAHAEGGLGRVFVAYDTKVGREVALKEMKSERADDFDSRDRFTREAEITGNLEHPGIVPVYGQGTYVDGRPYYAMRFIRGITLKEAIESYHSPRENSDLESPLSYSFDLRRLLKRLIDVCHAMQYAHSRGVLHRDLKPANVMLGQYGETLVVDWGLAKASGEASVELAADMENGVSTTSLPDIPLRPSSQESAPTEIGAAVGTPAYMSPEQAHGRVDLLDPRSDVFSLGAILYQVATGRPPYQATSSHEMLRLAKEARFPRPRSFLPKLPRSLEAICLKAMDPVMTRRYSSAAHLAHDLDRFLADEPITTYRDRLSERLARWARRHKTMAAAVAFSLLAMTIAVTIVAGVSISYNNSLAREKAAAEASRRDAEQQRDAAEQAKAVAEDQRRQAERMSEFIFRAFNQNPEMTVGEVLKRQLDEEARLEEERNAAAKQP